MAKEPSQLALMFPTFVETFPDDESCARFLLDNGWKRGRSCTYCGENEFEDTLDYRVFKCITCGKLNRIFAGTILFRVQRLRAWFAGLWFLSSGVLYSRKEFSNLFGIALDTAQRISDTISIHLTEKMSQLPSVPSAAFKEIFGRRSIETPARRPPMAEQIEMEKNAKENTPAYNEAEACEELTVVHNRDLNAAEKTILSKLNSEQFSSLDSLLDSCGLEFSELITTLGMLQLKGLVESSPGQLFKLPKREPSIQLALSETCKLTIEDFINKAKTVWHRITRKNVQLHLALYWSTVQTDIWKNTDLFFEILDQEPLSRGQIRGYISPLSVHIPMAG